MGILLVLVSACCLRVGGALRASRSTRPAWRPSCVLVLALRRRPPWSSWGYLLASAARTRRRCGCLTRRRVVVLLLLGTLYVGNSYTYIASLAGRAHLADLDHRLPLPGHRGRHGPAPRAAPGGPARLARAGPLPARRGAGAGRRPRGRDAARSGASRWPSPTRSSTPPGSSSRRASPATGQTMRRLRLGHRRGVRADRRRAAPTRGHPDSAGRCRDAMRRPRPGRGRGPHDHGHGRRLRGPGARERRFALAADVPAGSLAAAARRSGSWRRPSPSRRSTRASSASVARAPRSSARSSRSTPSCWP